MSEQFKAVLDSYHVRIEQEKQQRANATAPLSEDWRDQALLAVGPATGQLINLLVKSFETPHILEIGTSFGYSGLWLAEAAQATGGKLTTLELKAHKSAYAKEQATRAGLADYVDFKIGDALTLIDEIDFGIDFVLLDLWKDLYIPALARFYPKLNPGAIIVADNMLRPGGEDVKRYQQAVRALPHIRSILLPVGTGIEVSRYEPE